MNRQENFGWWHWKFRHPEGKIYSVVFTLEDRTWNVLIQKAGGGWHPTNKAAETLLPADEIAAAIAAAMTWSNS